MKRYLTINLCLILLVFFATALAADDKQKLSAAEIIGKHFEAVGGRDALSKFRSRVAIGTVKKESEPAAQMAIMSEAPNKVSAIYVFRDFTFQLSYDGSNAIFRPQLPKSVVEVEAKYRDIVASGLMFNSISLYSLLADSDSQELKMEARGIKKVEGRQAYVVEIRQGKAEPVRLYFDTETFMWVRTDYGRTNMSKKLTTFTNDVVSHAEDETTVDFYFETSDFRDVDGVKLPFKFEQVLTTPMLKQKKVGTITGTITEYRHNVAIDQKMFQ